MHACIWCIYIVAILSAGMHNVIPGKKACMHAFMGQQYNYSHAWICDSEYLIG